MSRPLERVVDVALYGGVCMISLLADKQRRERPYAIIGMIGSCVALVSFFLLPIGVAGFDGPPLVPTNGWEFLRFFLAPPYGPGSILVLLLVLLLPGCCCITLVIGGAGLFRPVPRRWVQLFTLALLPGLVLMVLLFFAHFATFQSLSGF